MIMNLKNALLRWNLPEKQVATIQNEIDEYNYNRLLFERLSAYLCNVVLGLQT